MTIHNQFKATLGATIIGMTILLPQQASAGLLNDVYNKASGAYSKAAAAYSNAAAGLRETRVVKKVVNGVDTKITDIQKNLSVIPDLISKFPDPLALLGDTREFLEDNIGNSVDMMIDIKEEFEIFKGNSCDIASECGQIKEQLINTRNGLKNIRNLLPINDILPPAQVNDPITQVLNILPPISYYSLHKALGNLNALDNIEDSSEWLGSLTMYKLTPIEDINVRTCTALRNTMQDENLRLKQFKTTMHLAAKVYEVFLTAIPKDVVVSILGEGTNIPSPLYPTISLVKMIASDAETFVGEELAARKEQASDCDQYDYQTEVNNALQELLAR